MLSNLVIILLFEVVIQSTNFPTISLPPMLMCFKVKDAEDTENVLDLQIYLFCLRTRDATTVVTYCKQ